MWLYVVKCFFGQSHVSLTRAVCTADVIFPDVVSDIVNGFLGYHCRPPDAPPTNPELEAGATLARHIGDKTSADDFFSAHLLSTCR